MKRIATLYIRWFQKWLPSPFSIAIGLTLFCWLMALLFTTPDQSNIWAYSGEVMDIWTEGIWGLLAFTTQMIFMLVMGHAIALSKAADKATTMALSHCKTNAQTAISVTFYSVVAGLINWGFGLMLGAILARKAWIRSREQGFSINYPLVAASGYTAMMVWHGGISGSAPLSVAAKGHTLEAKMGLVDLSQTIFSSMNLTAILACLIFLPLLAKYLSKLPFQESPIAIQEEKTQNSDVSEIENTGSEKFDRFLWPGRFLGALILVYWLFQFVTADNPFSYPSINTINLLFLGLAFLLHGSFQQFNVAVEEAMSGAAGILVQFPLYGGIMAILAQTGLMAQSAEILTSLTTTSNFHSVSYLWSAFVNIFIPSGGGQWQIQGPILMDASNALGLSPGKTTMSLAYGDQLTNMLQPFWAIPLLSITGLKAKDILPYSMLFMLLGGLIFLLVVILF